MSVGSKDRPFRVVWPLMISQTIGAFNDNAMKAMLPLMAAVQFGKASMDTVNQQVSILLIIPFVLFAPIAGWVTDRFSKKRVIVTALLGQLLGLGILGFSLFCQSLEFSLAGFFILSVQSAFFSPAKKGILKELIGTNRLAKAVGFMEMLAMVGILGGAFAGAMVFDQLVEHRGGWGAALLVCGFISILAFFSWVIAWPIPETTVSGTQPFQASVMINHFQDLFYLLKRKELRYAALGDAWFWGLGGFFYLVLVKISGEVVAGKIGMGTLYGFWFLLLGVGIMVGSVFVAYLNRGRIEIGLSAIGAMGMPFVFMGFCLSNPLSNSFSGLCLALGFFGALFFVPLNGYIQDKAKENERGRVLAASNLLTQLAGIFMILLHAYLSNIVGMSGKDELLVIMLPAVIIGMVTVGSLLEDFFRAWFHMLLRIFYRFTVFGMENFPKEGGCLLVSNHLSYADPVFIGAVFPRKVRYLAYSGLANSFLLRFVFRLTKTLTVSPEKSLRSIRESVRRLKGGLPLCVFAEGGISQIGVVLPFMRGPILLAQRANIPVIPVHLDGVWGSVFSMSQGRFFKKFPISFPYRVTVRVGKPLMHREITQFASQNAVMELGRLSFAERMDKQLYIKDLLNKQIFKKREGVFYQAKDGVKISFPDFQRMIRGECNATTLDLENWVAEIRAVIKGEGKHRRVVLSNWMRLQETHFWDYQKIRVHKTEEVWLRQFLPWAGILWGRSIYDLGNTYILESVRASIPFPILTLTGIATKQSGLVSLNASGDSPNIVEQSESKQKAYKENTDGRLLIGYSTQIKDGACFILGLVGNEKIKIRGFDDEGFVVSS